MRERIINTHKIWRKKKFYRVQITIRFIIVRVLGNPNKKKSYLRIRKTIGITLFLRITNSNFPILKTPTVIPKRIFVFGGISL